MTKDEAQHSRWTFYEAVKLIRWTLPYRDNLFSGRLENDDINRKRQNNDRMIGSGVN